MRNQSFDFGPWTTSLDAGSRMQLSAFWRQRMQRMTGLSRTVKMSRFTIAAAMALAVVIGISPLVELVPAALAAKKVEGDFVATFSNGVSVEFIGLGENPSANGEWWTPDGVPLEQRPYETVRANMTSANSLAREVCWRWHGIGNADVQTGWHIEPAYNGAGGGRPIDQQGKHTDGLIAWAISLDGSPETCTVKLSISVPATEWETQIKSQAGYVSSTGRMLTDGTSGSVSYLKSRADGNDTVVALNYKISGEARLAAFDNNGQLHVSKFEGSSGTAGFSLAEARFKNVKPNELKTWLLQTRQRESETVEFRNVSLHRGQVTDVEVVMDTTPYSTIRIPDEVLRTTPATAKAPTETDVKKSVQEQSALVELTKQLGYRLRPGQLVNHVRVPAKKLPLDFGMPLRQSGLRLFQWRPGGSVRWQRTLHGSPNLADVLNFVLHLKPHQIACEEQLLSQPIPGDWVVAWNPSYFRSPTVEEVAAVEDALNESLPEKLSLEWKRIETTALVVQGDYKFTPVAGRDGKIHVVNSRVAERSDGTFQIPLRRNLVSGTAYNSYQELLQAIGETCGLVAVDEANKRPQKHAFFFNYYGEVIPPQQTLEPAVEKELLATLSKQTGFKFVKETRPVNKLFVKTQP